MAGELFSFETLSKQEALERTSTRLTRLEGHFWEELRRYLEALEATYLKAHAEDASGRRTVLLSDELRNAMRKAESLLEARQRKIILHALKAARAEGTARPETLTPEELPFLDRLVALVQEHTAGLPPSRRKSTPPATTAAPGPKEPPPAPTSPEAAPAPATAAAPGAEEEIATVRALVDIPPFVGDDARTYRLRKGEVAALPKRMAEILQKRGKVVPVG